MYFAEPLAHSSTVRAVCHIVLHLIVTQSCMDWAYYCLLHDVPTGPLHIITVYALRALLLAPACMAGYTYGNRSLEMYIYNLKAPWTGGTFLLPKCGNYSISQLCKRASEGRCVHAFVDTPEHAFTLTCRSTMSTTRVG